MNQKRKNVKNCLWSIGIWMLLLAILLPTLAACGGDELSTDATTTEAPSEEDIGGTPTGPVALWGGLLSGTLNDFQVVRGELMDTTEMKAVLAFLTVLRANTGAELKLTTDYERDFPISDNEIVIGKTKREGKVYQLDAVTLESGDYDTQVKDNRLILRYSDLGGLMNGLEHLLLGFATGETVALKTSFAEALYEKGISRYEFSEFSLYNDFMDGMRLPLSAETVCYGAGKENEKVSIELYDGNTVLNSSEVTVGASGKWSLSVAPNAKADGMKVKVDGVVVARYNEISFAEKIYQAPSNGMKVWINGEEVDVYENEAGFHVIASLKGDATSATVKIQRSKTIKECTVRPLSADITPDVSGKEVSFTVNTFPCKLSVEFEGFMGDMTDSVQLYLHPKDDFDPLSVEGDVLYYGPGEYWLSKTMNIPSNTTIYVAEGAILHARYTAAGADNFTIRGRGIIDTFSFAVETRMMEFESCTNITLKDFMLTGPRRWMVVLTESKNCHLSGLSIVGTRINSDGVDIVSSQNVTIENCFLRSNDDCIAIKAGGSNVKNITITNCVFWNMEYGNAIEIGYETRTDNISGIRFEDNDIIHVVDGACMSIHLGDRAVVSDVVYRDMRIEDARGKLIEFFIKVTNYTKDPERGKIKNITISDIEITGDVFGRIIFQGYDNAHMISDVAISNIVFNGRAITTDRLNLTINQYTDNITYNGKEISAS